MPLLKKCGALILTHRLIVSSALVMSLLVSLPIILFPYLAGDSYRGINIAHFGTDEHYYLTRAKEILEGHGLGNIVLREGKNTQEPQFTYVEYAILLPIRALGLADKVDIVTLYNAYNFAGVFALVLLIYFFALEFKDDKRFAAVAALFVVGGYSIIYNKTIGSPELNIYGRAMFPYTSSLAFFTFALLLVRSLKFAEWKKALWAGMSFGVLFYIFFFGWSFALALIGSLGVVYAIKREWTQVKKLVAIAGIGLALGAYNLIRLLVFYSTEQGRQLGFFLWSFKTHAPILSKIGLAMIILWLIYWYRKREDKNLPVVIGFMLAGWVALNQQIITGQVVQYGHYYWFFIVPTSIVLGLYMLWSFLPSERWRTSGAILLGLIVFANSGIGQYRSTFTYLDAKKDEQRYRPILDKLNEDKNSGVVMAPDGARGLLVTIYTPHDVLWNSTALVYNTPRERLEEMLLWYVVLNEDSKQRPLWGPFYRLESSLDYSQDISDRKSLYLALEGITSGWDSHVYAVKAKTYDPELLAHRRQLLDRLDKAYAEFISSPPQSFFKKYRLRYIVWDKHINPEWDQSLFPRADLIAESDGVYLYKAPAE